MGADPLVALRAAWTVVRKAQVDAGEDTATGQRLEVVLEAITIEAAGLRADGTR